MIDAHRLLLPPDIRDSRVLLGVSGGVDSMTLADLFQRNDLCRDFAVASVNFCLRGTESDGDSELVRKWCFEKGIRLHSRSFDTRGYSSSKGISIEMAARDLRYTWFESLLETEGFDYVAVAHNMNDNCETLMLNLLRGTGLRGATGMKAISGRVIRPLLNTPRSEIAAYAAEHGVPFREDSTNSDVSFARNRIRNNIFPEFSAINPSFLETFSGDMRHFSDSFEVLEGYFSSRCGSMQRMEGEVLYISIDELSKESRPAWWLYRLLDGFGFDESVICAAAASIGSQPGALFTSPTHILLLDRDYFKVFPKPMHGAQTEGISEVCIEYASMSSDELRGIRHPDLFLDACKICRPLSSRAWREGDRFRPFGMKSGSRKVSDFLISKKIDRLQKASVKVVTDCGGEGGSERIVAVAGLEIDDRFAVKIPSDNKKAVEVALIHFDGFNRQSGSFPAYFTEESSFGDR